MAFPNISTYTFDLKAEFPDITLQPFNPDNIEYEKQKNLYSYCDREKQIFYEGQILDGKRNGFGVEYYSPNYPKISGYFLDDKLEGSFNKVFDPNGNTIFVGKFYNEQPVLGIVYWPKNIANSMRFAGTFKEWKIYGERVYFFYDDSSLKCVGKFTEGYVDDENLQIFHRNGVTWFKGYCKKDQEGKGTIYHNQLKFNGINNTNNQILFPNGNSQLENNFNNVNTIFTNQTTNNTNVTQNINNQFNNGLNNTSLRRYNCYELIKALEDNDKLYDQNRESMLIPLFNGNVRNCRPEGKDIKIVFQNGDLNLQADFYDGHIQGKLIIQDINSRKVFDGYCEKNILKNGKWENWGKKIGGNIDNTGLLRNFSEMDNSKLYLYDLRVELKFDWRQLYSCQSYYNNSFMRILDPVDLNIIYEGFHKQKRFHGWGKYCLRGDLVLDGVWNMEKFTGIAKDGQMHCKIENLPQNVAESGGFFGHGIKDYIYGFGRLYNYQRGRLLYQGDLSQGKKQGQYGMIRNFRGNVIYVGGHLNDKYEGRGTIYYEKTGRIKEVGWFSNGLLNGPWGVRYNEDGIVFEQGKFADGFKVESEN